MDRNFPRRGINKYMARFIASMGSLDGKVVVDIPAGDGRSSQGFLRAGARVLPLDLFPGFFQARGATCEYADLQKPLPVADGTADHVLCQEGIEHLPDQYSVFCEFNRILKPGGRLMVTTPNLSSMRSRLSMFLTESEFWKRQAPSEIDSVWFSESGSDDLYFGHLFLLNMQKMRSLAAISGFSIERIVRNKISPSSLVIAVAAYPALALASLLSYAFYISKNRHVPRSERAGVFRQQMALNLNYKVLACKHLFLVFRKERSLDQSLAELKRLTRR